METVDWQEYALSFVKMDLGVAFCLPQPLQAQVHPLVISDISAKSSAEPNQIDALDIILFRYFFLCARGAHDSPYTFLKKAISSLSAATEQKTQHAPLL